MTIADDATVAEARDWLIERAHDGVQCPVCDQLAKVYKRKITGPMAALLIKAFREHGDNWFYLPDLRTKGQDEAIMRYWGLIEARPGQREDGSRRIGWWRLTSVGVDFVRGGLRVFKYARIYDGEVLGLEGDLLSIRDVLGTRFNYNDLMWGR